MAQKLNPVLFRLLEREFGEVLTVADGEELIGRYISDDRRALQTARQRTSTTQRRLKLKPEHPGEEYRINCPFCNDTRRRLFINHRWAVKDEKSGSDNLWLAHCWNEECLANWSTQQRLWEMVFRVGRPPSSRQLNRGIKVDLAKLRNVEPPGPIAMLDDLKRNNPGHEAVRYLEDRGYDVVKLAQQYQVGFCVNSRYPLACDRIYIPIWMGGKLKGWQMRAPREWQDGDPPKYWSCPNMQRRYIAYNFDQACEYQTPVIVEGPIDVWGFGPGGMGCIGKTMNHSLVTKLQQRCGDFSAVVMLDPGADEKQKAKMGERYVHHIEKLATALEGERKAGFKYGVARIYLPEDTDPGSLDRDYMRDYIRERAKEQGVKVSFKKRVA